MLNQDLKVSDNLIHFLKNEEGFRDKAYKDSGGVWTIGYGNTTMGGKPVEPGMSIPKDRAETLMREKLSQFADTVKKSVKVPLSQNEFDALVSFTYNAGPTNFQKSTLLKKLNAGDKQGATQEFGKWVYDNKKQPVLKNRRAREAELFARGGPTVDTSGNTQIATKDKAGSISIADTSKKKVPLTPSFDSGGGLQTQAVSQVPNLSNVFQRVGQEQLQTPVQAVGDTLAAANPANLFFSPVSAQSEPTGLSTPENAVPPALNPLPQNPRPLEFPNQQQAPPVPQQGPQINTPGFLKSVALGLSEQPTSLVNLATRPINQGLIAAQDLANIGNPDVDKSKYATIPGIRPEDVVGSNTQFEQEHPIQSAVGRIAGDLAPTVGVYAASQALPILPRLGVLGAYFAASNIGKQIGDKQLQQDRLESDPALARGGLPDLIPQNKAETITAGVLGGAGELIVPLAQTGKAFAKALPTIVKDGPAGVAQIPGLITRTFLDKLASDPATVEHAARSALVAKEMQQASQSIGKMGKFVTEVEDRLASSKEIYQKAENKIFYKEIATEEKELINNLIKAYHETNYLAEAGIAGGDSELIQNIMSKSLKEGADVGDFKVMNDLMDARVVDPTDIRFQKLTPDQVLDLITYHAEKYGISREIVRDAMSDISVHGLKIKHLGAALKEAKLFLPTAEKSAFLETLSGTQRQILGEPLVKKVVPTVKEQHEGFQDTLFKQSAERENGIDVINKYLKANDIQKARDGLEGLIRKTKIALESSLSNFPVHPNLDEWGKTVQSIRSVGEDFLTATKSKSVGPEELQALKDQLHAQLNESVMKHPERWSAGELEVLKDKTNNLSDQLLKKSELKSTNTKGLSAEEKANLKQAKAVNKDAIKGLEQSIQKSLQEVDSTIPIGWTQDQYHAIHSELDDMVNLAKLSKNPEEIAKLTKRAGQLSRKLDAKSGLQVKGPGRKTKPDNLDVAQAEAEGALRRVGAAERAVFLKSQVGKEPASLSLAVNSFWRSFDDLLKNAQNKSLSLKEKVIRGGQIVNNFYEDASYVYASNVMHPTDMMNFARQTKMQGAEGVYNSLEGYVTNSHAESAEYISFLDEAERLGALPGTKKGEVFGKLLNSAPLNQWLRNSLTSERGLQRYLQNPDRLLTDVQAKIGKKDIIEKIPLTQDDIRHLSEAAINLQRLAKKDGLDILKMKTDGYLMHLADDKTQVYSLNDILVKKISKGFGVSSDYIERNLFKPYMEKNFGILEKNKNLSYDYITSMRARIGLSIYKRNTEALLSYFARVLDSKQVDPRLQAPMWSVIQQLAGKQSSSMIAKEANQIMSNIWSNGTKNILNTEAFAFLDMTQLMFPISHFSQNPENFAEAFKIATNPKLLEKTMKALKVMGAYQGSSADDIAASFIGLRGAPSSTGRLEAFANELSTALNPDIRKGVQNLLNHPFIEGPEFVLKTLTGLMSLTEKHGARTEAVLDAIIKRAERSPVQALEKNIRFGTQIKPGKQQAVTAGVTQTQIPKLNLVGDIVGTSGHPNDTIFKDSVNQVFNAYNRYLFIKSPFNSLLGQASTIGKFSTFAGRSAALLYDMAVNNPRALQAFFVMAYSLGGVQAVTPLMNNINWMSRKITGEDFISGTDILESQDNIAKGNISGPASFFGQLERMTNLGQGSRMSLDFAGPFPLEQRLAKDATNVIQGNYSPLEIATMLAVWGTGKSFSVVAPGRFKDLVKQFVGDPTSNREAERVPGIAKDTTLVYGSEPSRKEEIAIGDWKGYIQQYLRVGRQPIIFRSYVDGVGQMRAYEKDLATAEIDLEKAYNTGDDNLIRRAESRRKQLQDKVDTEKYRLIDSFTPFYKDGQYALEEHLDDKLKKAKQAVINDYRTAVNDQITAIQYKLENVESLSEKEANNLSDKLYELDQLKRILYPDARSYSKSEEMQRKKREGVARF